MTTHRNKQLAVTISFFTSLKMCNDYGWFSTPPPPPQLHTYRPKSTFRSSAWLTPSSRLSSLQRCVTLLDSHSVWILSCGFCSGAYRVTTFCNIQLSTERSALCPGPSQVSAQRQRPERDALSSVPVCVCLLFFFLFVFNSASHASNFVQQLEDECSRQRFSYFHPN